MQPTTQWKIDQNTHTPLLPLPLLPTPTPIPSTTVIEKEAGNQKYLSSPL